MNPSATPTVAVAVPSPSPVPQVLPFPTKTIQSILDKWQKESWFELSCVVIDLESGQKAQVDAGKVMEAASLVKLPILIELYSGKHKLQDKLVFTEEFRVEGSGELKKQPAGGKYTLEKLAELMVQKSDNSATDMLMEHLTPAKCEQTARAIGMKNTTVRRRIFDFEAIDKGRDNLTTAADMALALEQIARRKLAGGALMELVMSGVERKDMIPAGTPPTYMIAHKTGELTGFLHDAAIMRGPRRNFILVIMTKGGDREPTIAAIRKLTAEICQTADG